MAASVEAVEHSTCGQTLDLPRVEARKKNRNARDVHATTVAPSLDEMPLQKGRLKRLTLRSGYRKKRRLPRLPYSPQDRKVTGVEFCLSARHVLAKLLGAAFFQGMAQPYLRSQINS